MQTTLASEELILKDAPRLHSQEGQEAERVQGGAALRRIKGVGGGGEGRGEELTQDCRTLPSGKRECGSLAEIFFTGGRAQVNYRREITGKGTCETLG